MRSSTLTTSLISPSGAVLLHRASCNTACAEDSRTRMIRVQLQAASVRRPAGAPVEWTPIDDAAVVHTG